MGDGPVLRAIGGFQVHHDAATLHARHRQCLYAERAGAGFASRAAGAADMIASAEAVIIDQLRHAVAVRIEGATAM